MIKQAIIPLAGQGTRLLPLTSVFAKELLPINGKPGIEYILDECIEAGIREIVFIISNKKKMHPTHMQKCWWQVAIIIFGTEMGDVKFITIKKTQIVKSNIAYQGIYCY